MSWAAVAVAGAAVVGGMISSNAASDAASTQSRAANRATDLQNQIFQQQRADQEPWRVAGAQALSGLQSSDFQRDFTAGDMINDPGYQMRMAEGQKALERSAAARGGSMGGATLKALTRYSQDQASQEYGNAYNRFNNDRTNRFNRLSAIAGLGQTANNTIANAASNYGNNASQNMMSAANAQAAGTIGQANAMNNTLGTAANSWMNYQMMNRMFPSTGTK